MGQNVSAEFLDNWVHTKRPVAMWDDTVWLTDDLTALWNGWRIRVLRGYRTDGASIKTRVGRFVVGHPWGEYLPAAIVHDILYETEALPRADCDRCFLDLMAALGVPWWKRRTMHAAVRVGGWVPWRRHTAQSRGYAADYLELDEVPDA